MLQTTRGTWRHRGRARAAASTSRVRWGTGYETVLRCFVNVIATPKGGTHVSRASSRRHEVLRTFRSTQNARRPQGQRRRRSSKDDILEGLTAVRHRAPRRAAVRGPDQGGPRHAGRAAPIVSKVVAAELKALADRRPSAPRRRRHALVMEKVVAARPRPASRRAAHKETQRRKNALESSALPVKLADCRTNDIEQHRAVHRRG